MLRILTLLADELLPRRTAPAPCAARPGSSLTASAGRRTKWRRRSRRGNRSSRNVSSRIGGAGRSRSTAHKMIKLFAVSGAGKCRAQLAGWVLDDFYNLLEFSAADVQGSQVTITEKCPGLVKVQQFLEVGLVWDKTDCSTMHARRRRRARRQVRRKQRMGSKRKRKQEADLEATAETTFVSAIPSPPRKTSGLKTKGES